MSYLIVITGVVISLMLNLFEVFSENKTPPFFFMIYPPFSFYRYYCKELVCDKVKYLSRLMVVSCEAKKEQSESPKTKHATNCVSFTQANVFVI